MRHAAILGLTLAGLAMNAQAAEPVQKGAAMTARGTFDVKVTPQPPDDSAAGPFQRLFLDKQFHGDLEAGSKGQMMGAQSAVEGSGAYVAFEQVTGVLSGKKGSFMLQHRGTMRKGSYLMDVTVVPDSGTEELAGIAGTMTIVIEGGKHSYVFEYRLESE
ncbi:MAG: DUF3224 domain-containing protein [Candidatus Polarisedimenticolia bacterium]